DLDRRFARDNLPDHADLLANLVRWVARDKLPLLVEGPGLIDCHLYHRPDCLILHLLNLTNAGAWRAPLHELIAVGPLRVKIKLPKGAHSRHAEFLVAGGRTSCAVRDNWATFVVKSVLDHEVVVLAFRP